MIDDVESFTLIDATGNLKICNRTENRELFRLVIGGYGLFGVIGTVKVRLTPVTILERVVELIEVGDFIPLVTKRIQEGFLYGDFQFAIDPQSDDFMILAVIESDQVEKAVGALKAFHAARKKIAREEPLPLKLFAFPCEELI